MVKRDSSNLKSTRKSTTSSIGEIDVNQLLDRYEQISEVILDAVEGEIEPAVAMLVAIQMLECKVDSLRADVLEVVDELHSVKLEVDDITQSVNLIKFEVMSSGTASPKRAVVRSSSKKVARKSSKSSRKK